jgi:hypothetical protein
MSHTGVQFPSNLVLVSSRSESQPDYKTGEWGVGRRDKFLAKIQWQNDATEKHKDHGSKAPYLASCGGQSNGDKGHNSDGGCLGLWKANAHLNYQQLQAKPKESARPMLTPHSCMDSHLPTETPSILPSYVPGSQLRSGSYTSNRMIMQRALNRVYLGLFRHAPAHPKTSLYARSTTASCDSWMLRNVTGQINAGIHAGYLNSLPPVDLILSAFHVTQTFPRVCSLGERG